MAFFGAGFFGIWLNKKFQVRKSAVVNGRSVRPFGMALLFPGGEMFLSITSSGDLVIWKRATTGKFIGIKARIPVAGITSLEHASGKLRATITFRFSDGSKASVRITARQEFDAFSASLQAHGVATVSV